MTELWRTSMLVTAKHELATVRRDLTDSKPRYTFDACAEDGAISGQTIHVSEEIWHRIAVGQRLQFVLSDQ